MTLHWELKVKFRFLFDWGNLHKSGDIPVPIPVDVPAAHFDTVVFNGRGVWLRLALS